MVTFLADSPYIDSRLNLSTTATFFCRFCRQGGRWGEIQLLVKNIFLIEEWLGQSSKKWVSSSINGLTVWVSYKFKISASLNIPLYPEFTKESTNEDWLSGRMIWRIVEINNTLPTPPPSICTIRQMVTKPNPVINA